MWARAGIVALLAALFCKPCPAAELAGFRRSAWFGEQVRTAWLEASVRVRLQAAGDFEPQRPTRLVIYATPNGNTLEWTLGSALADDANWRADIQHVAAQIRAWRAVQPHENIVLACVEPAGLSWPAWRQARPDNPARIRRIVEELRGWLPGAPSVTLAAHSGGGSFLHGFVDAADALPDWLDRCIFLDANYSYSDELRHSDKFLAWLRGDRARRLVVIAYDDREITLNGQRVVGPTGGTFRATQRFRERVAREASWEESRYGAFHLYRALDGQIVAYVHPNPDNKILHTALVGEMNGLLEGLSLGRDSPSWGEFGGPRAYAAWVQPAPGMPARPADAPGGAALLERVAELPLAEREEILAQELLRGNLPEFLRHWRTIAVRAVDADGKEHTAEIDVLPDYLAVGSDADWVRVPLTPQTGMRVAEAFGALLPTRKIVDEVARQATVRLTPQPLTTAREAVPTFVQHHRLIEEQWGAGPRGDLVVGIKKDVVLTNRLAEKPRRLGLYGWHQRDGSPIQPLTIVHHDRYVDYSHGVRLVKRRMLVDGRERDLAHVLQDARLSILASDEGPLLATY